ncbi:ERC protein 2 isoform X2 [Mobula birostris]|uniref:ERC protein 2 isoform X2 n=1 Tax=Mobula birostris TaxID=1983395 RepID=UPI003B2862F7
MYGSSRAVGHVEGSPSRSPRLPRSPRLGHRRTNSSGTGGAGKTLSMENIQSLNAAYATSGPMYLSDHEGVASTSFPKGTMTLGRATNRATYGGRVTAMGSSPNIASAGLPPGGDALSFSDHHQQQHSAMITPSSHHHHHHHQVPSALRQVRDNTMVDLQAQLKELQRENETLRKELEIKDTKLGSSMNSIKTFWSPELKKERVLRKEEAARMSVLKEQMRVSHEESQHLQLTIQALQDELRTQRDLNHLLQQENVNRGTEHYTIELTEENFRRLQAEHERQAKELFLLRKTLEEMELRIETQKQTLNARDESIKKLLEMLQNKGLPSKSMEEEHEKSRRISEAESQVNHLEVLLDQKEKENIQLREVDALRLRLEEKESFLNKKTKQLQDLTEEKGTLAGEIRDMKDMLEVKERKINVLQKKIENLQEQLKDKDKQLNNLKDRVKSLQTDSSNTDTALATLEEALSEKERIIERLKEQRERDDRERLEEVESYKKENKDLKEKINNLQAELAEKESSLIDLKEHASSLASTGLKKDSKLKTLEIAIEQKKEECSKLEAQLKKAHDAEEDARLNPEMCEKLRQLEKDVAYYKEESDKSQAEVDRLLEILKEVETEKNDRDKKIAELERQLKDQNKKVANLKHKEQMEKKKNAQLLEEARKREDNLTDNSQQMEESVQKKDERIEELEEALRESVQINAEREVVLAREEASRSSAEKQLEELMATLEKTKQELDSTKVRLTSTQQSLAEREAHLANLRIERRKQLEEVLEMKQEALLAAISEKDANIALLELSASKKKKTQDEVIALKREKDRLVQQLKQQTQNRMKLMADNYDDDHHHHHHHHHHHRSPARSQHSNHRPSPDQMIQSLLEAFNHRIKLKLYIDHLTALCLERNPQVLAGLPSLSVMEEEEDEVSRECQLQTLTPVQLAEELERGEKENVALQEYTDNLLQRISDLCPDVLEQVIKMLEEAA